MTDSRPLWADRVTEFIQPITRDAAAIVNSIDEAIKDRVIETTYPANDGRTLILLQMHNRTIEREEVFMGGVVFNDWLFKSLPRAIEQQALGTALSISNDLETAYFVIITDATTQDIQAALRTQLANDISRLFFAGEEPSRGLHGAFSRMLHGISNNQRDPFPNNAVPRFMARDLEKHVRTVLYDLINRSFTRVISKEKRKVSLDFRAVQTTMANFYGRHGYDWQSHDTFMTRLAFTYGLVTPAELRRAYNLPQELVPESTSIKDAQQSQIKDAIKESVETLAFDEHELRAFFLLVLNRLGSSIDTQTDGPDTVQGEEDWLNTWLLPYLRLKNKLINVPKDVYLDAVLSGTVIGSSTFTASGDTQGWPCRTCGEQRAKVAECNILLGVSVNKFYNQRPNQAPSNASERICIRCALYSYLGTKLFGCRSTGSFPVPKQDNIIFHVGKHSQAQTQRMGWLLNRIIQTAQEVKQQRYDDLRVDTADEETRRHFNRKDAMARAVQRMNANEEITDEELALMLEPAMEIDKAPIVANILEQVATCQVIDLGMGEERRLVAFALPKLPGENDLTQKRFTRSRLTVYALIGFLQQACGCREHGAFFFRTVPRLDTIYADDDTFYVEDKRISGQSYRTRYRAAASFAIGVTKPEREYTASWLRLSERLANEPLETFSAVLRDSAFRAGDDRHAARYRAPSGTEGTSYDNNTHIFGGWSYVAAYRSLRDLWEDNLRGRDLTAIDRSIENRKGADV